MSAAPFVYIGNRHYDTLEKCHEALKARDTAIAALTRELEQAQAKNDRLETEYAEVHGRAKRLAELVAAIRAGAKP